jgi:aerobic-type carbon monoxide dehydrogenase small subunit (CoxS/CutS family)
MITKISFTLNGKPVEVNVPPTINLLRLLRDVLDVTSVKYGCEEGNCGACTVQIDGQPTNSCLVLAPTIEGRSVTTLEGIGTMEKPHPLQKAFYEYYAAQCGFCTPGMLMAAKGLLDHNLNPTRDDVVGAIAGNVCRCTGYEKIIEAIQMAAKEIREQAGG